MIEDTNEARMREAQDTKDSVKESVYLKILYSQQTREQQREDE